MQGTNTFFSGALATALIGSILSVAACGSTTTQTVGGGDGGSTTADGPVACGGTRGDLDCAPWSCTCQDAALVSVVSCGTDGFCASSDVICPTECTREMHGGWTGTATGGGRAAGSGKTPAGGTCASADDCLAYSCKCADGTPVTNAISCAGGVCLGRSDLCMDICGPRGGWVDP